MPLFSSTKQKYAQKFQRAYEFLNAEQRQVVDRIEGPVMVVAGPGAGKTQVMSLRAANILKRTDVMPESVLCLTFTDSATQNLQKRLSRFIGNAAYDVSVFTFHGFATHLRSEFGEFFYNDEEVKVVDDLEQVLLIQNLLEELPLEADLRKKDHTGQYLYMGDVRGKLSQLKRGGYSAEEFTKMIDENAEVIVEISGLVSGFLSGLGRISKKKLPELVLFFEELRGRFEVDETEENLIQKKSWIEEFLAEMGEMILEVQETESTKPFSAWKKERIVKDKEKNDVLKDFLRLEKNRQLASVYVGYEKAMKEQAWVDFDDLLMEVRQKLREDHAFRASVQEKYMYVMVDEFQDTSGLQMEIVSLILDGAVSMGLEPNIMVVGDDDQSIYKFQGAKVSNILQFKKVYPGAELIVLDKNYRSRQPILDLIRGLVVQGEDRLENHIEELSKELVAGNSSLGDGVIEYHEYEYEVQEFEAVAGKLKDMLDSGADMEEVAVIARGHRSLRELSKLLRDKGVPFSYEHSKDILESEVIEKIYKILLYLDMELDRDSYGRDDILVEILAFDFWNIPRLELWKFVNKAYKERKDLIDILISDEHEVSPEILYVVEFLVTLSAKSRDVSVFEILEFLLGQKGLELSEEIDGEPVVFVSPLKEHYFPSVEEARVEAEYLGFLMDLKTLFDALKDYKVGEVIRVHEVVEYMSAHMDHGLRINNNFNLVSGEGAVNLMTAHKSKGMEFGTVFVLSCNARAWESRGRVDKLKLPLNVHAQTAADDLDDFLRLFYVALSRAKENLYLSSYLLTSSGKDVKPFRFLNSVLEESVEEGLVFDLVEKRVASEVDERSVELDLGFLMGVEMAENVDVDADSPDELSFLKSLVVDYKLSVTAFNNFLDLSRGGPKYFLEKNLLRFPQAKSVAAEYGTAMHYGISQFMLASKNEGRVLGVELMLDQFEKKLRRARVTDKELKEYSEKGKRYLNRFYQDVVLSGKFGLQDLTELSFGFEEVKVGEALLNGAIDWVACEVGEDGKEVVGLKVIDFKTGSALESWDKNYDEYKKMKAWKYKNQLIFYYLLMRGHRKWASVPVLEAGLYFLEADGGFEYLSLKVTTEDIAWMERLVKEVYRRIVELDFPDVSGYTADFMGTLDLVEYLINN